MTGPTDATPGAPVDRKAVRKGELAACLVEVLAVLEKYDATFGVMIQTIYADGIAQHNPIVQVVSK